MSGACSMHGKDEKCVHILVRICEGKRPLGRPRHRWEDESRMNLWEIGWEGVDWNFPAQDRDQ